MKKSIIIVFVAIIFIAAIVVTILVTKKDGHGKLYIESKDGKSEIAVKKGNKFKCDMLSIEYEFTIDSISDDEITLYTPTVGLTPAQENGGISLRGDYNVFYVEKGKETKIYTQTTDYQDVLALNWK